MSTSPAAVPSPPKPATIPAGTFVWHELTTPAPDASASFYGDLLGWSTKVEDMGPLGPYTVLINGDRPVAGLVPRDKAPDAQPTGWLGYAAVPDLDAALALADTTVHLPTVELPGMGRFAIVADPTGGIIAPFEGTEDEPVEESSPTPTPGMFFWHEVMTPDPEAAVAYYRRLFGWSVTRADVPDMGPYWIFAHGEEPAQPAAGAYRAADGQPAQWLCYIGVEDTDAAAARAAELGGHVVVAPTSVPEIGRFALLTDPHGSVFGVFGP